MILPLRFNNEALSYPCAVYVQLTELDLVQKDKNVHAIYCDLTLVMLRDCNSIPVGVAPVYNKKEGNSDLSSISFHIFIF